MPHLKKPEYIVDEKGDKKKVILDYHNYLQMLDLIQDFEDSKLIKKTKTESEIPLEEYKRKRNIV